MVTVAELLLPLALLPITEYTVVDVGDTMPLLAEALNPVLVQAYEVAVGVQLTFYVALPPTVAGGVGAGT